MASRGNKAGGVVQKDLNGKIAKKRVRVMYRRATIELTGLITWDKVYTGVCQACKTKGRTELHHTRYAYSTKMVRAHPLMVLDFTIELCYLCHKVADYLRNLLEDPE